MTPTEQTVAQRCEVARAVTGIDGVVWRPDFRGSLIQSKQALMLVEWLADRIMTRLPVKEAQLKYMRMMFALKDKSIPNLESLVLELLENEK